MKIHLVRHGRSVPRAEWSGEELLRPLSAAGEKQADALVEHFGVDTPTRIVCAPSLRCQQTVEPLAARLGIEVEVDDRLTGGEPVARPLELLPTYDDGVLLFCTHSDVIIGLLQILELVDVDRPDCRKGSVWTLAGSGYTPSNATYSEPVGAARGQRRVVGGAEREGGATTRAAVLDLGSTSFNLLIADVDRAGSIVPVVREKVMLRLGAVIADSGSIPDDVFERAAAVALDLSEVARREKVDRFFPVATAALRSAPNGEVVARTIGAALGHPVRILSGEEEARTTFRAFQQRLDLGPEPVLGLDLGGGSLELAVGSRDGIEREVTLELGVVRMLQQHVVSDPIEKSEQRAVRGAVRRALEPHVASLSEAAATRAIATGGTVRALARLIDEKHAQRGPRRGAVTVDAVALRALRRELVASSHEERSRMRGINKGRSDLMATGAVILDTVASVLGIECYRICDWGLREGVLLDGLVAPRQLVEPPRS